MRATHYVLNIQHADIAALDITHVPRCARRCMSVTRLGILKFPNPFIPDGYCFARFDQSGVGGAPE